MDHFNCFAKTQLKKMGKINLDETIKGVIVVVLHIRNINILVSLFRNGNTWFPICFVGIFITLPSPFRALLLVYMVTNQPDKYPAIFDYIFLLQEALYAKRNTFNSRQKIIYLFVCHDCA